MRCYRTVNFHSPQPSTSRKGPRWGTASNTTSARLFGAHKLRRNRLLVAAHYVDHGGGAFFLPKRIDCGDTLPGCSGHEALAKDSLDGEPCSLPILPRASFIPVQARNTLQAVAKQIRPAVGP